ncbi:hypothetical protein [Nostoc sp. DedQUE09]|uniref:hypothetical protein n=1 Tax=Nostoc sp. DedQUE09 TaxID=3075394 RepID=UPI002AD248FC|nr:hypothetical protein [Nostoc sp. DedQUE09]MDZ7952125.1 hypothetical protein [Nostoc sp. DedQUE09]
MSTLSELQSKKLGLFELISLGFDIYLKKNRLFLGFLLIYLPFVIILIGFSESISYNFNSLFLSLSFLFYIFYIFVIVPIYVVTLSLLTESCVFQENIQPKAIVRRILSRILPLIGLWVRFSLTSSLLFLLLIVPGIIYSVNNGFCLQAFILRDQRGKAAFQYSRTLVKGNWWKTFFLSLLSYIIVFGLQGIFNKILSTVIANYPIVVVVISNVLAQVIGLGVTIGGVLLFLNLEFQKQ